MVLYLRQKEALSQRTVVLSVLMALFWPHLAAFLQVSRRGREGGDNGLFITLVPKVFIKTFSYSLSLTLLGLKFKFDWLVP